MMTDEFEQRAMPSQQQEFPGLSAHEICGCLDGERCELRAENERLQAHIAKGQSLVNDMDLRMPEQATEDADGWINSYRIPVGPWHRLLGWARGGGA
jgi:hypothetical protein